MRSYYKLMFRLWTAAQVNDAVGERIMVACFEDLTSRNETHVNATGTKLLDFLYNGTAHNPFNGIGEAGGHASSHDPELIGNLTKLIKELDERFYNGEIAWLDSVLPC